MLNFTITKKVIEWKKEKWKDKKKRKEKVKCEPVLPLCGVGATCVACGAVGRRALGGFGTSDC